MLLYIISFQGSIVRTRINWSNSSLMHDPYSNKFPSVNTRSRYWISVWGKRLTLKELLLLARQQKVVTRNHKSFQTIQVHDRSVHLLWRPMDESRVHESRRNQNNRKHLRSNAKYIYKKNQGWLVNLIRSTGKIQRGGTQDGDCERRWLPITSIH